MVISIREWRHQLTTQTRRCRNSCRWLELVESLTSRPGGEDDSPLCTLDGHFILFGSSRSGERDLYALPMQEGRAAGEPILVKSNIGHESWLKAIATDGKLFH